MHSKYYRSPLPYAGKRVLVVGNSASGHDLTAELVSAAALPVLQSRRTPSRWDGAAPPPGIAWKPVIRSYLPASGRILFADGTHADDVDVVVYCTGYKTSFPFWDGERGENGGPLWDYGADKLARAYWHTFFRDHATLGIVGLPRALTFRSFEYQAIALARLFSGRNAAPLPPDAEQERWERDRLDRVRRRGTKFHDVQWETGETFEWLEGLFRIAGLGTLKGDGRVPPALTEELIWAVEHVRKYPEPGKGGEGYDNEESGDAERDVVVSGEIEKAGAARDGDWVLVERQHKDLLAFI